MASKLTSCIGVYLFFIILLYLEDVEVIALVQKVLIVNFGDVTYSSSFLCLMGRAHSPRPFRGKSEMLINSNPCILLLLTLNN